MDATVTTIATDARRRKADLEAKLKKLLNLSGERSGLEIEYLADPLDRMRSGVDRDITVERLNCLAHLIQEVLSAIGKMQDGTFGICEECSETIAQRRLDAIPWARLCVKCQSQMEARRREELRFGHAA